MAVALAEAGCDVVGVNRKIHMKPQRKLTPSVDVLWLFRPTSANKMLSPAS
jgi:hypothetical protein